MKRANTFPYRPMLVCLLSVLLTMLLTGCGSASQMATDSSAEPEITEGMEAVVNPAEEPEPTPEPTPVPETPESRAAALGLPAPPDIDITSWEFAVANMYNSVNEYVPESFGFAGAQGLDARIVPIAQSFLLAARSEGVPLYFAAGFRSYEYCLYHYENEIVRLGSSVAAAAQPGEYHPPGVNEHQLGLALDIIDQQLFSEDIFTHPTNDILYTDTYAWAVEHCAEYGFILRYPEGKEAYYGSPCIAGHFRYVGEEAAQYIMENDLCLEEFLLLYDDRAVYVPGLN